MIRSDSRGPDQGDSTHEQQAEAFRVQRSRPSEEIKKAVGKTAPPEPQIKQTEDQVARDQSSAAGIMKRKKV